MRPLKPLPSSSAHSARRTDSNSSMKPKRRFRQALRRARRRTIDPTKWGSQHLKGAFLDSIVVAKDVDASTKDRPEEDSYDSTNESQNSDTLNIDMRVSSAAEDHSKPALEQPNDDLAWEKMQSLTLLESMFAGLSENQDWEGRETIDSDIEMGNIISPPGVSGDDMRPDSTTGAQPTTTSTSKLKDLFAPQEEQGTLCVDSRRALQHNVSVLGFSLLGHLNLDLEIDNEEIIPVVTESQSIESNYLSCQHPSSTMTPSQEIFDPEQPLFFPMFQEARSTGRGKGKDLTGIMKDRIFDWREGFFRTESSADIAKRWEITRGELTRDWKRRHREAARSQRRRGDNDVTF
jgi:hypothetical protein